MIRVDYRIGSRQLLEPLRRAGVRAAVSHQMRFGDFAFTGSGPAGPTTIGVERKTVNEIIGGLTSPGFKRQLRGLLTTYPIAWLIIEGYYRADEHGILTLHRGKEAGVNRRWTYDVIEKFVIGITSHTPIRIKHTMSTQATVLFLKVLHDYYQKPWSQHSSLLSVDEAAVTTAAILSDQNVKRSVFAQLPGVYWVRSQAADASFASIYDAITADRTRWQEVNGIGPKLARGIVEAIRKRDE